MPTRARLAGGASSLVSDFLGWSAISDPDGAVFSAAFGWACVKAWSRALVAIVRMVVVIFPTPAVLDLFS